MTTTDKLTLMKEITRRNDERWNITSEEQEARLPERPRKP